MPTFDWPRAPFPQLNYPLSINEHTNRAEEDRCLDGVRELIKKGKDSGSDVAALIIEPITGLNNQIATPYFYK